ncbi:helix-turn-helix domain-containing protein [Persicitalea jodogahamensis]|uniref:HTH cro/C1-type domain-containing protein n=1 Tax=Persicitalea jodogahamensis TaxID=402147 RepID=A0A8J3GC90_9BACT|nr:helix-turn-helix transcriptional regulator [Persicitalea jodogahamensis]GHB87249.1 hypothetical protein GCM10007390_48780 [Persicitalea jodogahamensis]
MKIKTLGEIIQEIRKSKKMTQAALGDLSGCSRQYLSGVENGTQTISEERAGQILACLGHELATVHYARPIEDHLSRSQKKEG